MIINESIPQSTSTLESVKAQFAQWRSTRVRGNRIPSSLWNAAISLTRSYHYKQIASELKISSSRLCKKMKDLPLQQDPSLLLSSRFVEVASPFLASSDTVSSLKSKDLKPSIATGTLELTRTDGTHLKASGLDNKALFSLIQSFVNP